MPRKGTIKTPQQKAEANRKARERRAAYRLLNPLPPKLTPEESKRRAYERSVKANAKSKAIRDAERAAGIPAKKRILSAAEKQRMRIRVKEYRAKQRLIKPPRIPMTPEQLKERKRVNSRKQYEKRLALQGKTRQVPITKRKMEKILKARPANRISEKVIKPVKVDLNKQVPCEIKSNDTGKIKVRLDAKTEVYALPGYDIEALRRKYLRV